MLRAALAARVPAVQLRAVRVPLLQGRYRRAALRAAALGELAASRAPVLAVCDAALPNKRAAAVVHADNEAKWAASYARLQEYAAAHRGSVAVPWHYPADQLLATWARRQRQQRALGKLSSDRVAALEQLGFVWHLIDDAWETHYHEAAEFAVAHNGSLEVKRGWAEQPKLATWVATQRALCVKKDELEPERAARLEALSYSWGASDAAFAHGLKQLAAYAAARGGSTVVPAPADGAAWPGGAVLREWCRMQRLRKQHGTLPADRVARLEQLHFVWDEDDAVWQDFFKQLQAYAAANGGSTRVPSRSRLSPWAVRQRGLFASGKLDPSRAAQLNSLRFTWQLR